MGFGFELWFLRGQEIAETLGFPLTSANRLLGKGLGDFLRLFWADFSKEMLAFCDPPGSWALDFSRGKGSRTPPFQASRKLNYWKREDTAFVDSSESLAASKLLVS